MAGTQFIMDRQTAVSSTHKVLRNTYMLLSMTLLFSAAMAGVAMAVESDGSVKQDAKAAAATTPENTLTLRKDGEKEEGNTGLGWWAGQWVGLSVWFKAMAIV